MKNILLIIGAFLIFQNSNSQTKNVYWVHGMSGDPTSLKLYADKYAQERTMNSYRPDAFPTNIGITGAAERLQSQIQDPSGIVIAHSMGGVNVRQLRSQLNGQAYGGLITLGSPHSGAIVANNIDNGILDNFISDANSKSTRGIKSEPAFMVTNVLSFFGIATYNTIASLWGNENIPPTLFDLMNDLPDRTIRKMAEEALGSDITKNQLKTNSQVIAQLSQYSPEMPMIAIYGNEDAPAFLRFVGARQDNKIKKPLHQISDTHAVDLVNYLAGLSNTKVDDCWVYSDILWLFNPVLAGYYQWAAGQWQISADFYGGQLQTGCDFLIGAKRTGYQYMEYCDWVCRMEDPLHPMRSQLKTRAPTCRWPDDYYPVYRTVAVPIIISTPSDGLIPIDSEKALPGCNANNKYEALHANHEELKNHQSVTILLNDIFNGTKSDTRNPSFFKVDPK